MAWDHAGFNRRLADAADAYDQKGVRALIDELLEFLPTTDEVYPSEDARRVLDLLRRKRDFAELERAAAGLIQSGQTAPVIRRLYSQALIEEGQLATAMTILGSVAAETEPGSKENLEARGLLGRAHKQAYLDGGTSSTERSRAELRSAVEFYQGVYGEDQTDPVRFWHGINAVGVLMRAQRDGVELEDFPDPRDQAAQIKGAVELRRQDQVATMWDYGTAAEACVALGLHDDAVRWMASYVQAPNGDAFEYGSTLRQLEDLWGLTPETAPGQELIPLLRAGVLRHEGGCLDLDTQQAQLESLSKLTEGGTYEAVLGADAFEGVRWLQTALERAGSVGLVTDPMGTAMGTAFVIRAEDCCATLEVEDEFLLITNAHVISPDPDIASVLPADARITFESEPDVTYEVAEVVWTSPLEELDTTFVRTDPPITGHPPMPVAAALPKLNSRVYIIGHPQGRPLSYSIYDNRLLNAPEPLLHYRTPTEGGSSGSPVFNRNWQLVGLHHKGSLSVEVPGEEELQVANEGVMFTAITEFAPTAADMPPEFADPESNAEELDPKFGIETSTASLRNLWSAWRCNEGSGRFGNPMIYGKSVGGVAKPAVDAFLALEAALKATGYQATSRWAFNCRKIGKSTKYSLHSYGIAIDIDPRENPFTEGDRYSGKIKRQHVDAVLAIKNKRGQSVWSWGGAWKKPDRMHFQINRGPNDVDVNWATVLGGKSGSVQTTVGAAIADPEVEEDNVLTRGATGAAVTHFQKRLLAWNGAALPKHQADGDYGQETVDWIKEYQKAAELEVTGNIDGVTAALLQGDIT